MVKVEKLDWRMDIYGANKVSVALHCANFEQSLRFIEAFKAFIFSERDKLRDAEASHAPKTAAGEDENSQQGQVQGKPQ